MNDLLRASPGLGAYRANPFDAVEIDEHIDGDRIWATILEIRNELERYENEADDRVQSAQMGELEAKAELNNADIPSNIDAIEAAFDGFISSGHKKAKLEALQKAIKGS